MALPSDPVWLITGCSTGFGRELARVLLDRGARVVATARTPETLESLVAGHGDRALALRLDVTDPAQIAEAVGAAEAHFGRVDVLVNNAGIGYFAAVEESEEDQARRMFEINYWGLVAMTNAVLPGMRARRAGHIVNVSSIAGLRAFPAVGHYAASKHAVEGMSEALSMEVGPLGIGVTIVEPSGFRTDWAGRSADESPVRIEDYAATAGANRGSIRDSSGRQPGDPVRAAEAIVAAVTSPEPPLRLLLGAGAWKGAHWKIERLQQDFEAWKETTLGADAPPA